MRDREGFIKKMYQHFSNKFEHFDTGNGILFVDSNTIYG